MNEQTESVTTVTEVRRLDFLGPVFHHGLNYTVRLGTKWANLLPGDEVALAQTDGPLFTTAEIRDVTITRFNQIPDFVFAFEHAPSARTPEGLIKGMQAAYGDKFQIDSIVTVIGFVPRSV